MTGGLHTATFGFPSRSVTLPNTRRIADEHRDYEWWWAEPGKNATVDKAHEEAERAAKRSRALDDCHSLRHEEAHSEKVHRLAQGELSSIDGEEYWIEAQAQSGETLHIRSSRADLCIAWLSRLSEQVLDIQPNFVRWGHWMAL